MWYIALSSEDFLNVKPFLYADKFIMLISCEYKHVYDINSLKENPTI